MVCYLVVLSYVAQCDAMRISKKFTGDTRIGHVRYPKNPARRLSQVYLQHQVNILIVCGFVCSLLILIAALLQLALLKAQLQYCLLTFDFFVCYAFLTLLLYRRS
jgi:uncharacterized membrane protein